MKNLAVAILVAVVLAGCGQKATVVVGPVAPPAAAPTAAPAPSPAAPAAAPAASAAAKDAYPLTTCVVSGEKLGAMGDPVVVTRDGVEIHLCCKNCLKELDADPKKYEAMVTAAKK